MYTKEELKELKRNFWTGFDDYCKTHNIFDKKQKNWLLYNTKLKNVELKFDANRDGAFVILELNHRNESKRLETFERFELYKTQLEREITIPVIWEPFYIRDSGQNVSRIYCYQPQLDIHRTAHWPQFYAFMAENMRKLQKNFLSIRENIRDH